MNIDRGKCLYCGSFDVTYLSHSSPAQRFKQIIMNAIDELFVAEENLGRTPTRIKLTDTGANIIEHTKVTTETFDELELSLADRYIDKLFELREEH